MKRVFGAVEALFDIAYLITAISLGLVLLMSSSGSMLRALAGIMALVLAVGDSFHLLPRIRVVFKKNEESSRRSLGLGKLISSVTMTIFYLLMWYIGLRAYSPAGIGLWSYIIVILAAARILLCLLPQNKWFERYPPVKWGIIRNIPFFLQGLIVAGLFFFNRSSVQGFSLMWLAVILSFAFYLPVVIWASKNTKVGMLMLPKSCVYVWMLIICLSL